MRNCDFFVDSNHLSCLVDADGGTHGGLDGERLDVLPALLEEGDEEVDGAGDVINELVLSELDVANSDAEAKNLLHLELDLTLELEDLGLHVIRVGERGRELTSLVETGAEELGDLTEEGLGGEESVVLLGELLDELLVLLESGELVDTHARDTELLGLIEVNLVTKDADLVVELGGVGETDNAGETLLFRGVEVLEADLELDSLDELAVRLVEDVVSRRLDGFSRDLAHFWISELVIRGVVFSRKINNNFLYN